MKQLHFFSWLLCFSLCLAGASCSRDALEPDQFDPLSSDSHGQIVLGDRLDDPYTLKNMSAALAAVYPTKAAVVSLEATDHYVRLLPKTQADLNLLDSLGVQMTDHPMDYEILKEGDWYHDPAIPDGSPTWQYAVVPSDFIAPAGIDCELIDECYIPSASSSTKVICKSGDASWIDWDLVERQAFEISGNAGMLTLTKGRKSEYPKGRISIMDEGYSSKPIGLHCVKMICNVFVKVATCYTDEAGNYEMGRSFASSPRYRIEFTNRKGFSIGMNMIFVKGSVSSLGKHSPSGYSATIDPGSDKALFRRSVINNAAYDYYKSCTQNGVSIKTPPSNLRFWYLGFMESSATPMLRQGPVLGMDFVRQILGDNAALLTPLLQLFLPDIVLGLKNKPDYEDIYRVTVHELAHASHFMYVGTDWWDELITYMVTSYISSNRVTYGVGIEKNAGYCAVAESWAYYVQNILYRERYGDPGYVFGSTFWFRPEILIYLDDRGINRFRIFRALDSNVKDMNSLKKMLLSLYPECRNIINEAFLKYL